jgi:alkanesulfonate monooxygenase
MSLTGARARAFGRARSRLSEPGVQVFTINPRSMSEAGYWPDIQRNIQLSRQYGATGVLCFSGNDTQIDPWIVAGQVATAPRGSSGPPLTPLVALNPNTMPPFTAAKLVSSIEQVHGARVALNLITGVSSRDRETLDDQLPHDDRYARLDEYVTILDRLLTDTHPVSFEGRFYRIREAQILPRSRTPTAPDYFVAGHSEAARATAERFGATHLRMLSSDLADSLKPGVRGLAMHFGVVARETDDAAWAAARSRFPDHAGGQATLEATMGYTDSQWKRQLHSRSSEEAEASGPYWLGPFRNFYSDCPFLVGSHDRLSEVIVAFRQCGVSHFVLDLPPDEEEFDHAAQAFDLASQKMAQAG